jgi:hypothetical protein
MYSFVYLLFDWGGFPYHLLEGKPFDCLLVAVRAHCVLVDCIVTY